MSEETPRFDARLKEGVAYFEEMLKVMPDDRTTLEFLVVVYPQLGETEKAEGALAALVRVLLKEGDLASASALLPRLEALLRQWELPTAIDCGREELRRYLTHDKKACGGQVTLAIVPQAGRGELLTVPLAALWEEDA